MRLISAVRSFSPCAAGTGEVPSYSSGLVLMVQLTTYSIEAVDDERKVHLTSRDLVLRDVRVGQFSFGTAAWKPRLLRGSQARGSSRQGMTHTWVSSALEPGSPAPLSAAPPSRRS